MNNKVWKNKNGTSENSGTCKCGSWKNHWLNSSGKIWPIYCSAEGCYKTATDGAHIYNTNSTNKPVFIVPLCHACNEQTEAFALKPSVAFVLANKDTCK